MFCVETFKNREKALERIKFLNKRNDKTIEQPPRPLPTYYAENDEWLVIYTIKI